MKINVNIKAVNALLVFLVLLDLILSSICLLAPAFWAQLMHGTDFTDSLGLIRRLGGVWLGFFVFQLIALLVWRNNTWWLVLVAGIRLTESFSDWIYWYFSNQHTWFGNFGLLIAPPGNWIFGIILIKVFLSINKENNYKLE